jgi:hypothetical protein
MGDNNDVKLSGQKLEEESPFPLTDVDKWVLSQTDEEFHLHTWDELREIIGRPISYQISTRYWGVESIPGYGQDVYDKCFNVWSKTSRAVIQPMTASRDWNIPRDYCSSRLPPFIIPPSLADPVLL